MEDGPYFIPESMRRHLEEVAEGKRKDAIMSAEEASRWLNITEAQKPLPKAPA